MANAGDSQDSQNTNNGASQANTEARERERQGAEVRKTPHY